MIKNKRLKELTSLKMFFNGDSFIGREEINKDFNIHNSEIVCDSDSEWDLKIFKLKNEIKKRKNN